MRTKSFLLFLFINLLFCLTTFGQINQFDSLKNVIRSSTDSIFFDKWAYKLLNEKLLTKFEKKELADLFVQRTEELKYPIINAHYKLRVSILKTIDGEYDGALKLIEEIIPTFEKYDKPLFLGACYNSSGGILAAIGDVPGGINRLNKAMGYTQQVKGNPKIKYRAMSNHYNVLGTIYFNDSTYDKALEYFSLTYELAQQNTSEGSTERSYALLNLSHVLIKKGQYQEGKTLAQKSLAQAERGNYMDLVCYSYHRIGLAFKGQKNNDSALYYFNLMENKAKKFMYNTLIGRAQFNQSLIYKDIGKPKLALNKYETYSNQKIKEEKEKNKTLTNFLITQTEKNNQERANLALAQEKIKRGNLQLITAAIIALLLLILLVLYIWYQRRKLNQKIKDEQSKIELMQSQIKTIGSQMNPHFMFNALNSVQDLILQQDVRASSIYLAKFADLMRNTLDASQKNTIALDKEIEILQLYLELESLRFADDFNFEIYKNNIPYSNYNIPAMLLQPYVENAVKHGLLHKVGEKTIQIYFEGIEGGLKCIILDNGVGRSRSEKINKRRAGNHHSFATQANETRLNLINQSSEMDVSLSIKDLYDSSKNAAGTQVNITFLG